ncbi:ectoine synthase [Lignipirellula cremea]|uniref:L-ectoine synthase n=1 Tax=Lignipirellula cremea TaxID=2528010 RepID=A0A518DXW4_9BACT|nr:ectoine synthase [Lignipirellula cremea]QDU96686.1 L-ectoine synthase [Lignipirellula cremea]
MIVKNRKDLAAAGREVQAETWTSRRFLLAEDGMGFSLHDTTIHAGTTTEIHYQNHLEAVYCIQGSGRVQLVDTGEVFEIEAGVMYALNGNEKHLLIADTQMRMVCVFNPALVGPETHDENGVYPLLTLEEA